jgi:pyruvate dehydrogenase E1 component alpha subunit
MAVLWKLPLIYVCENNQYTEFTHWKKLTAGEGLAARARAMGMPGIEVDGNDVVAVYQAARQLVEAARRGEGPATLVCHTIRYGGHHVGDPGTAYRTKEEMDEWRKKDSIQRCERLLVESGILSPQEIETTRSEIEARIQNAVQQARQDPFPPVEEVSEHVYA